MEKQNKEKSSSGLVSAKNKEEFKKCYFNYVTEVNQHTDISG